MNPIYSRRVKYPFIRQRGGTVLPTRYPLPWETLTRVMQRRRSRRRRQRGGGIVSSLKNIPIKKMAIKALPFLAAAISNKAAKKTVRKRRKRRIHRTTRRA